MSEKYRQCTYYKVAQLHCDYINKSFLASLGPRFLAMLYEAIDKDKSSVLIVKEVDGDIIGFVSGTASLRPIYKSLLLHPFSLFMSLIRHVLSLPKLFKIFEILLLSKNNPVLAKLPNHELLTIAIDPKYQGQGHAEDLFNSLCEYFKKVNVKSFKVIVGADLSRAHAFYLKMGCNEIGEVEVHKGNNSLVYIQKCT